MHMTVTSRIFTIIAFHDDDDAIDERCLLAASADFDFATATSARGPTVVEGNMPLRTATTNK